MVFRRKGSFPSVSLLQVTESETYNDLTSAGVFDNFSYVTVESLGDALEMVSLRVQEDLQLRPEHGVARVEKIWRHCFSRRTTRMFEE
jgi:hypothetical protein